MQKIDIPVTALKTELVTLTESLLEQMRILRVERGSLSYDGKTRLLRMRAWGEEMELPLLGYVWAPATHLHRSCYWLLVARPSGLQRIWEPAMSRHHYEPPLGMEGLPQIFVVGMDGDGDAPDAAARGEVASC